jgi:hypothetical protein
MTDQKVNGNNHVPAVLMEKHRKIEMKGRLAEFMT